MENNKTLAENLILFETAKLAKEKGFELESIYAYFNNHELEGTLCKQSFKHNWNEGDMFCTAPTQSLLQKWLREVHNIDITVITDWIKGKRFYYVGFSFVNQENKIDIGFSKDTLGLKIKYKSYEDALEAGLQEALKTIYNHHGKS